MNEFLSEENISLHREYVRKKQLELSILESSIPGLSGASVADIWHMRLTRRDRQDALALKLETLMHGIFFSSFSGVSHPRSEYVTRSFGSEAAFLNEIPPLIKAVVGKVCMLAYVDGKYGLMHTDIPSIKHLS